MSDEMEMAFPGMEYDNNAGQRYHYGLTKREYFAGLALQGIMANPHRWADIERRYLKGSLTYEEASMANARKAASLADALLKALEDS